MSCCQSRRPSAPAFLAAPRPAAARAAPLPGGAVRLRYTDGAERALRGPASGQVYRVGQGRTLISAEAGDAEALLRTGLFLPVGQL